MSPRDIGRWWLPSSVGALVAARSFSHGHVMDETGEERESAEAAIRRAREATPVPV
jgi:hypothetical protein